MTALRQSLLETHRFCELLNVASISHANNDNIINLIAHPNQAYCVFVEKHANRFKAATGSICGYQSVEADTSL